MLFFVYTNNSDIMKKIDYIIRSDLALQNKSLNKLEIDKTSNITVKNFSKKEFNYVNIIFNDIDSRESKKNVTNVFLKELKKFFRKHKIKKNASCLVVGLGNSQVTSDSLGTKTVNKIKATGYVKYFDKNLRQRLVYTFTPGVMGNSGYMAFQGIKAISRELNIDFVIVIDALVSNSTLYLNKLIEISDKGVTPGSGISGYQEEISAKTLGMPVLVVGAPTVVEASTIIRDVLNLKTKKVTYKKGYDLIVSSKDVDLAINNLSDILSTGINKALNFNIF